jgi:hypothetical protein
MLMVVIEMSSSPASPHPPRFVKTADAWPGATREFLSFDVNPQKFAAADGPRVPP